MCWAARTGLMPGWARRCAAATPQVRERKARIAGRENLLEARLTCVIDDGLATSLAGRGHRYSVGIFLTLGREESDILRTHSRN